MLLKWSSCPASLGGVIGTTVEPFSFINDDVICDSSSSERRGRLGRHVGKGLRERSAEWQGRALF